MINTLVILSNIISAAAGVVVHSWLLYAHLARRAWVTAVFTALLTACLLIFTVGYSVILLTPEQTSAVSIGFFRYAITPLFLSVTAVSASLFHSRGEERAARARAMERQALVEAMRRQEAERRMMAEAVRQELINRLVNNVGHEIRTPLTGVFAYIDMLLSEHFGPLPDPLRTPLAAVKNSARRIGYIVDKFIIIARMRLNGPHKSLVDLTGLAQQMVTADSIWINTRRQPGSITIEYEPVTAVVYADEDALRAVLFELLHNAIKFNRDGGTVRLRAEPGDPVVISVSDSGIGIEARYQMKIFDEAYQVESDATRRYEGMGMGLALVRVVAEAHGGYVHVNSTPDQGSTFRVVIPNG